MELESTIAMSNNYTEPSPLILNDLEVKYSSLIEQYEIRPEQLVRSDKRLGEGNYGEVWLARLYPFDGKDMPAEIHTGLLSDTLLKRQLSASGLEYLPVAVKAVREDCQHPVTRKKQRAAIRAEINVLCQLGQHDNVLLLLAAITTNQAEFCMVTEFCALGSLEKYLQNKLKEARFINELVARTIVMDETTHGYSYMAEINSSWLNSKAEMHSVGYVATSDLLSFASQVADGMQYLHRKNIIHRDLALRNVLLKSNLCIKIADFGLSRLLIDNEAYHQKSDDHIPTKWTAPEVLLTKEANIQSDYWTFGILLWELFYLGAKIPFQGLNSQEQFTFVMSGKRLELPPHAPQNIYDIMLKLWHVEPDQRLNLDDCRITLGDEFQRSMSTRAVENYYLPVIESPEQIFLSPYLKSKLDEQEFIASNSAAALLSSKNRPNRPRVYFYVSVALFILVLLVGAIWLTQQYLFHNKTRLESENSFLNSSTSKVPPKIFTKTINGTVYSYYDTPITFAKAQDECEKLNATVAMIKSQEENDAVLKIWSESVKPGIKYFDELNYSNASHYVKLRAAMLNNPVQIASSRTQSLEYTERGNYIYPTQEDGSSFFLSLSHCHIAYVSEGMPEKSAHFAFQKHSAWLPVWNEAIRLTQPFQQSVFRKYFELGARFGKMPKCDDSGFEEQPEGSPLDFDAALGPLLMLGCGLCCAIVAAVVEYGYYKFRKARTLTGI